MFQGVKRFDNIKSNQVTEDVQNPESRLFLEFKQRRLRPETKRYNEWTKQKQENDFKFREVLPFGGVIKRGGNLDRRARDDFEKRREQNLEGVVFDPHSTWNKKNKVGLNSSPR